MMVKILQKIRPNSEWIIKDGNLEWLDTIHTEPTKAEIDAGALLVSEDDDKYKLKTEGVIYPNTSYKIPFKSEDAVALMQVNSAFSLGVTNTNIYFSNGTIMPMTSTDFPDFATWFVAQRNSFFV